MYLRVVKTTCPRCENECEGVLIKDRYVKKIEGRQCKYCTYAEILSIDFNNNEKNKNNLKLFI